MIDRTPRLLLRSAHALGSVASHLAWWFEWQTRKNPCGGARRSSRTAPGEEDLPLVGGRGRGEVLTARDDGGVALELFVRIDAETLAPKCPDRPARLHELRRVEARQAS